MFDNKEIDNSLFINMFSFENELRYNKISNDLDNVIKEFVLNSLRIEMSVVLGLVFYLEIINN